jgi:type I restriction enzyme R subunit
MKALLLGILGAYERNGESELASNKLSEFMKARYGSVSEGKNQLGGLAAVKAAYLRLQATLYRN